MSFVRSSKYRHIFGNPHKDNYSGVKVTRNSADSTFCAANPKFVAIVVQGAGGGPFLVLPLDKVSCNFARYLTVFKHLYYLFLIF